MGRAPARAAEPPRKSAGFRWHAEPTSLVRQDSELRPTAECAYFGHRTVNSKNFLKCGSNQAKAETASRGRPSRRMRPLGFDQIDQFAHDPRDVVILGCVDARNARGLQPQDVLLWHDATDDHWDLADSSVMHPA